MPAENLPAGLPADLPPDLRERLSRVRLLALDVDGVLTDGGVLFDDAGGEIKRFHIHDGLGIVLAGLAGLQVAWITGRTSSIVERRAKELKVAYLLQGVRDKAVAIQGMTESLGIALDTIACMGDDLNDLPMLRLASVAIAPSNAVSPEVRLAAHWVTPRAGGAGAVRDAIELILRARGDWNAVLDRYLSSLAEPDAVNPVQ